MKLKSRIALLLAVVLLLSLSACAGKPEQPEETVLPSTELAATPEPTATPVPAGFTPEAKQAISDLVRLYGTDRPDYDGTAYVVSDFDNTACIFDITYQ